MRAGHRNAHFNLTLVDQRNQMKCTGAGCKNCASFISTELRAPVCSAACRASAARTTFAAAAPHTPVVRLMQACPDVARISSGRAAASAGELRRADGRYVVRVDLAQLVNAALAARPQRIGPQTKRPGPGAEAPRKGARVPLQELVLEWIAGVGVAGDVHQRVADAASEAQALVDLSDVELARVALAVYTDALRAGQAEREAVAQRRKVELDTLEQAERLAGGAWTSATRDRVVQLLGGVPATADVARRLSAAGGLDEAEARDVLARAVLAAQAAYLDEAGDKGRDAGIKALLERCIAFSMDWFEADNDTQAARALMATVRFVKVCGDYVASVTAPSLAPVAPHVVVSGLVSGVCRALFDGSGRIQKAETLLCSCAPVVLAAPQMAGAPDVFYAGDKQACAVDLARFGGGLQSMRVLSGATFCAMGLLGNQASAAANLTVMEEDSRAIGKAVRGIGMGRLGAFVATACSRFVGVAEEVDAAVARFFDGGRSKGPKGAEALYAGAVHHFYARMLGDPTYVPRLPPAPDEAGPWERARLYKDAELGTIPALVSAKDEALLEDWMEGDDYGDDTE